LDVQSPANTVTQPPRYFHVTVYCSELNSLAVFGGAGGSANNDISFFDFDGDELGV
jgi:hypothetical protein